MDTLINSNSTFTYVGFLNNNHKLEWLETNSEHNFLNCWGEIYEPKILGINVDENNNLIIVLDLLGPIHLFGQTFNSDIDNCSEPNILIINLNPNNLSINWSIITTQYAYTLGQPIFTKNKIILADYEGGFEFTGIDYPASFGHIVIDKISGQIEKVIVQNKFPDNWQRPSVFINDSILLTKLNQNINSCNNCEQLDSVLLFKIFDNSGEISDIFTNNIENRFIVGLNLVSNDYLETNADYGNIIVNNNNKVYLKSSDTLSICYLDYELNHFSFDTSYIYSQNLDNLHIEYAQSLGGFLCSNGFVLMICYNLTLDCLTYCRQVHILTIYMMITLI